MYKVIGTRPIRPDGTDKVTGRAQYGADIRLTGMLYGRVKRSPHAHAMIKSIDASKALALPGVRAVVTARRLPRDRRRRRSSSAKAPAHAAACLVDRNSSPARRRSTAATPSPPSAPPTRTSPRTPSTSSRSSTRCCRRSSTCARRCSTSRRSCTTTCAPREHAASRRRRAGQADEHRLPPPVRKGDVDAGLRRGRRRSSSASSTTRTLPPGLHRAAQRHRPLEPGRPPHRLDQHAGPLRRAPDRSPSVLQMPVSQHHRHRRWRSAAASAASCRIYLEPLAALLSKKTGKPVKMTMTREEVFEATGPTSGTYVRVKIGAKTRRHARRRRRPTWPTRPAPTPARPSAAA